MNSKLHAKREMGNVKFGAPFLRSITGSRLKRHFVPSRVNKLGGPVFLREIIR
jgi:hypothetical protein